MISSWLSSFNYLEISSSAQRKNVVSGALATPPQKERQNRLSGGTSRPLVLVKLAARLFTTQTIVHSPPS